MSKVVIIGGMAAGCKAAARLRRLSSDYDITIIERQPILSYGNCGMPFYAAGDVDDFYDLAKTPWGVVRDADFFKNVKDIDVLTETEVVAVDTNKKEISCKSLKDEKISLLSYDSLIFATGSKTLEPLFPCPDSPKISTFYNPEDAKIFKEAAQKGQVGKAVIIGGGFIGCELTEAMTALWGIETVLIEKENSLLQKMLDREFAEVVMNIIGSNDIEVLLSTSVEKIELNDNENPIVFTSSGKEIETDYVFLNLGVAPNSDLAKAAGIQIGECGGIVVDDKMKTSIPEIWAAGDCVEIKNLVSNKHDYFALGSLSNRMGRIAADSISGKEPSFKGAVGAVSFKIFDTIVCAAGITDSRAKTLGYDVATVFGCWTDRPDYHPDVKDIFAKLVYEKESLRLLGIQLFGEGEVTRYVDVISILLFDGKTAYDLINLEHAYTPPHSSPISPLNNLGYMVINQAEGNIQNINPLDINSFNGLYLDVREESELEVSPLANRETIKLTPAALRTRMNEIEKDKPIMVICQRGPRSYETALFLKNNAYNNVSYLGGGVSLYDKIFKNKDKK